MGNRPKVLSALFNRLLLRFGPGTRQAPLKRAASIYCLLYSTTPFTLLQCLKKPNFHSKHFNIYSLRNECDGDALPIRGVAVPIRGIALPIGGVVVPIHGIVVPIREMTLPIRGIVVPIGGITLPIRGVAVPIGEMTLPIRGIVVPIRRIALPIRCNGLSGGSKAI